MSIKIAQINLKPAGSAKTTSEIYISEPDTARNALAGRLFVLIELENNKANSLKIINFLIDRINRNYYQNEKIYLKEKIKSLKTEHIFESALAKTNKDFYNFISNEKIKLSGLNINITSGVIHENTLYFANTGKNKVFLIYKKKIENKPGRTNAPDPDSEKNGPEEEYSIINLIGEEVKADKTKLFTNVISGQMPPNSFFLVSNEALPEYVSSKQIVKIISTLPPVSAVEQIKNILSKINFYVSFIGLIIKNPSLVEKNKEKPAYQAPPIESITDLSRTENETEILLTPSGIISLKKWLRSPLAILRNKIKIKKQENIALKDKIYTKKKASPAFRSITEPVKNIFLYFANFFYYLYKNYIIKERAAPPPLPTEPKLSPKNRFLRVRLLFSNFSKKSKILLVLFLVFMVFLAINITRLKVKTDKQDLEQTYNDLISEIEKKQNQAEANLLYSNEEGAKKLFDEINNLLGAFPQETEQQKEQYSQFYEKYNLLLEKTRRVVRIDGAAELADLSKLNSAANPENITIIPSTNKLYCADSSDRAIYIMETADKVVTTITDLAESITALKYGAVINDNIYYLNNGGMVEFDTEEEAMTNLNISLSGAFDDLTAADSYSGRLYLLNNKNSQIYRYDKSGLSFTGAYSWIQDNLNLENAVDMSIDGHVYILENNGEVLKLLRGNKIDFKLEAIDPPLENPKKIYVSGELKYIYILEKTGNRLVVYDKTGQFIVQYKSDKLNDLKDFSVDENAKIIYLLSGTSIYSFAGEHFD